ncbi:hypothetical protein [Solemya velesiana gill symbiont]|uniref:Uncharacterized protein n=1 Tax=Solemya velesiana gill symbiont TaxID=1918948 RepID=A0A1T2KP19_9GAMM|nr:hypothetical protein [Solemya velesiana gill symbiont]OOZ34624.1 hypothetical protein BOW51_11985 [Solemya velesiana gill symbiont]
MAQRTKSWESRADDLLTLVRDGAKQSPDAVIYRELLTGADDAADSLEDAAFLLSLLPEAGEGVPVPEPLLRLADLLVSDSQEWIKCLANTATLYHGRNREDIQDFLQAVDQSVTIEHLTDEAEREVTSLLVRSDANMRQFHL